MMYRRKIETYLKQWKEDAHRKPLIIKGCRQCGKTSSVLDFVKKNYKHVVYLNFHEQKSLTALFNDSLQVDYLLMLISATIPTAVFVPHKTCIVFDEIQDCPQARSSLKFFKLDGRYDVICTGSLLGVNGYMSNVYNKDDDKATIPVGFETIIDMYPMDFEEWLWANNIQQPVFELLEKCLREEIPVPDVIHTRLRQLFLQYVVVGGMPEAVRTFLTTHDVNKLLAVQRNIVEDYKTDMVKYATAGDKVRIRECFESIPMQLARDNKKFTYSLVKKGGRSSEYVSNLQWIEDAGVIKRCYNLSITELPLGGNALQDCFKVYMADTGLFVSMLDEGTQSDILKGNLLSFKGAIFENAIADVLGKMGHRLYYFKKVDSLELDFLIRFRGKCVPLECKAKTGNAKSLQTVLKHPEKYHIDEAVKLGDYNVGRNDRLLTLPWYMSYLLTDF